MNSYWRHNHAKKNNQKTPAKHYILALQIATRDQNSSTAD